MTPAPFVDQHPAWPELSAHAQRLRGLPLARLAADAPAARIASMSRTLEGLHADFSRQRLDPSAQAALFRLAAGCGLNEAIAALFAGEWLNHTEARPALHMALRGGAPIPPADRASLAAQHAALAGFCERLAAGRHTGSTGQPIRHVIHIGIGGSDLGPRMAFEALAPWHRPHGPVIRFAANLDPSALDDALVGAAPASTLFIIASKSFTTLETLANARRAQRWLRAALGEQADLGPHLVAISNATAAAVAFGVAAEQVFSLPEWVGGRFSLWSAIGLPVRLALGEAGWADFLAGAAAMDRHFAQTPLEDNLPVWMALTGLWNINFLDLPSLAVLPYCERLQQLPAFLQQLDMESNGKHVRRDGSPCPYRTAPVVWGGTGTLGQHAFHQLFYQGSPVAALDFIVCAQAHSAEQAALNANALAQAEALMHGRDLAGAVRTLTAQGVAPARIEQLAPHLVCPGNVPSTTLILDVLSPHRLGQLLALYEHKIFVQGWLWGLNSFDQFGVELGKEMARALTRGQGDPGTQALQAVLARFGACDRTQQPCPKEGEPGS